MKFSRERFQNGSLRRVGRKTGPDVWEFRFRDHSKPGLPMRQMTLSTLQYPTETAARRALQAQLLGINGNESYIAQRSPTFGIVLDKFIVEERLKEIMARRPGEFVDDGLKFSTTTGYLSVIKQHLRPTWGTVQLTDIKPLAVQEWLKQIDLSRKTRQNIKAVFHRMMELAMLWGLMPAQRNPLSLVEIKGGSSRPRRKKMILTPEQFQQICERLDEPFRTMVVIAMCLGLRVSEILALKWSDFDFEEGTLMITRGTVHARIGRVKTEYSEDEMPLHPAFAEILLAWQARCPASRGGLGLSQPEYRRSLARFGSPGRHPCSGRQGTGNRATWLAHVSAQLPLDARCLRGADRRATEADASCTGEHDHEIRECLHDRKAEGARSCRADGSSCAKRRKSGSRGALPLNVGFRGVLTAYFLSPKRNLSRLDC